MKHLIIFTLSFQAKIIKKQKLPNLNLSVILKQLKLRQNLISSEANNFFRTTFIITITIIMECEENPTQMQIQEPIMMMIDGLFETEDNSNLFEDLLGSEPQTTKKGSINYDYQPAQVEIIPQTTEESQIKTSNRSTSTCADDSEVIVRKCTCAKTRCQKNYCECFKLGEACSSICECRDCGNKEKLFLSKPMTIKIKCKCLKSHCLKNYCECHSSGQRCGPDCKCVECENLDLIKQQKGEDLVNYFEHHLFFDI